MVAKNRVRKIEDKNVSLKTTHPLYLFGNVHRKALTAVNILAGITKDCGEDSVCLKSSQSR